MCRSMHKESFSCVTDFRTSRFLQSSKILSGCIFYCVGRSEERIKMKLIFDEQMRLDDGSWKKMQFLGEAWSKECFLMLEKVLKLQRGWMQLAGSLSSFLWDRYRRPLPYVFVYNSSCAEYWYLVEQCSCFENPLLPVSKIVGTDALRCGWLLNFEEEYADMGRCWCLS